MPAFICTACGMQYAPTEVPPTQCRVCEDERQFTPPGGQSWTTLGRVAVGHLNAFRQHEPGLIGIGTQPTFAIGQRALLVCTPNGNVLWDCISLIDEATVALINGLGGLKAIAISHPHFYTTLVEWSRAFGNVPVHLHAEDFSVGDAARSLHRAVAGRDPGATPGRDARSRWRSLPRRRHAALGAGCRRSGRGLLG